MTQTRAQAAEPSFADLLAALRNSHDRLVANVTPLTDDQLAGRSYASEWTIAQVASHLGSGAEIFTMVLDAGRRGEPAPGIERMRPIWAVWNEKSAQRQAADAVASDARFLAEVDTVTPDERASWRIDLFGGTQTLTSLLRMRLSEHAVHTWDIAVALDPTAAVAADAVDLIVDNLPALVARTGKGTPDPIAIHVATTAPGRDFLLDLTPDGAVLTPVATAPDAPAGLHLSAEAFTRLVYGRLDADHTPPAVTATNIDIADLRGTFPGF
ncbi:MAG: hypothetical protein V7637_4300 [Mycobacteriales bacterium]|jgi:uncharacterized protein (TIGR03083 family)